VKQILAVKYQVFSQLSFYWLISQINFSEFSINARAHALGRHFLKRMENSPLSLGLKRFAPGLFCARLLTMSPRRAAIGNPAIGGEATTAQAGKARRNLTANSLRNDFKGSKFQPETLEPILMNDVVAAFNEYFEIIDADSPELLCEVFHLRYQVLCIEQRAPGFEASNYPKKMESDSYDRHSSHILLRHRPSEKFVGTARLILSDPLDPYKLFPTERHMRLDPALIDVSKLPRQSMGEISRLVVVRRFSRRRDELLHALENGTQVKKWAPTMHRRFPHPMLALAVGIIRMSVENSVNHWLSVMEPALNRLLGLYGLQLDPVGPTIDHHGLRRPYYADLVQMLDRMYKNHNQFWELVTDYGKVRPVAAERLPEAVQVGYTKAQIME
jgi:N-acyl amino acid synthase of PEP-CTERM/exosortase system